jgi:HSP20 family protein
VDTTVHFQRPRFIEARRIIMLERRHLAPRLARWPFDPLAGLEESARSFDPIRSLFGEIDREFAAARLERARGALPRIDMVDDGSELRLLAELPGFTEKDIELEVHRNLLTLRGRRQTDVPDGYTIHRRERRDLQLARTLTLPYQVDAERVEATLSNGVLRVTMPKAAEERPRQIAVRTAGGES